MSLSELTIGRKVQLPDQRTGTIRFTGQIEFAPGLWVGVELDEATGKNDGSINGVRYFDCEMGYGMFYRPSALKLLAQPAAPFMPQPAKKTARPSSMVSSGSSRGSTNADSGSTKQMGLNAPSPASGQKASRPSGGIGSPTKQPGSAPANAVNARNITPSNVKPAPGARPRLSSIQADRASVAPPPMPVRQTQLTSPPGTGPKAASAKPAGAPVRVPSGRVAAAKSGIARPSIRASAGSLTSVPKPPTGKRSSSSSTGATSTPKSSDDEVASPPLISPVQTQTMALEELTGAPAAEQAAKANTATKSPTDTKPPGATVAPSPSTAGTNMAGTNMAANKEIEELKAKLRVLEKKRTEDREKLSELEHAKSERDRFERIIKTLEIKYQPQQQEIADLKRQLKEAEHRLKNVEEMQQDHLEALELVTLDREMAQEMAEAYKAELDQLKQKTEELQMEIGLLREENAELTKGVSPEERASAGRLQLEKNNERLREALIRLRDISRDQEEELKAQVKSLQQDLSEFETVRDQLHACKEELARKETAVEDLREQLDNALGAEEVIETLTEQTMNQSEQIRELQATVRDLEELKEVSDELEINHIHNQREMQEEIDKRDAVIAEQIRQAALMQKANEDMEYTLSRFRELVTSLQSDLADMRASHAVTESESEQLSQRSRAMQDLNMKLQISAAKAQAKTVDLELHRMEAQEARQHLEIVTMFLHDTYQKDEGSVLALLRFKRLAAKADILSRFIKERITRQPDPGHENEQFEGCAAVDKLAWVSHMCHRFINSISHCTVEQFGSYHAALYELEPVERALNGWIEGLKQDNLKEKQCAAELQRTVALMTHLGEVHISQERDSFADEIYMKASLMQTYLESIAVAFAATAAMVQRVVAQDEEGKLAQVFSNEVDSIVTQSRSAKVIAGRAVRALEELMTSSLTVPLCARNLFVECEAATAELAELARGIGLDLHGALHEEGRTEPYTYSDIQSRVKNRIASRLDSDATGIFSWYLDTLQGVTTRISEIFTFTDRSTAEDFERRPAPWLLRRAEVQVLKSIPAEAELETRRLREELAEAKRTIAIRNEDLSMAQLRIEMLESRMSDVKTKERHINELEQTVKSKEKAIAALDQITKKRNREIEALKQQCNKWKGIAIKQVLPSDIVADGDDENNSSDAKNGQVRASTTSFEVDRAFSNTGGGMLDDMQAAVRYLNEDNHHARTKEQSSREWLAEPLRKKASPAAQQTTKVVSESRAVLGELVNLAGEARVYDMSRLPADKVAWKPAKSTPQYHAAKQVQEFADWEGRKVATVQKVRSVRFADSEDENVATVENGKAFRKGKAPASKGGETLRKRRWWM
ncbi:hypothetical protein VTH06DRAFT_5085 [Thermothelomyces fergusii]